MKDSKKIFEMEEYRSLKDLVETYPEAATSPKGLAAIVDFSAIRLEVQEQEAQREKAKQRSLAALKVLNSLVKDYEAQMLVIAHQYDRQAWIEEHNQDPYAQIDYDMTRLNHFMGGLRYALEEKGATTLQEACEILRQIGDVDLVGTIDYILQSDYVGFIAMRHLIESLQNTEVGYAEDVATMGLVLKNLEENNFLYSIEPLSILCLEQAVAV